MFIIRSAKVFFGRTLFLFSLLFLTPHFAAAGFLAQISDTITNSAPSATTTHTLMFTASSGVPASGSIVIIPEGNGGATFNIPASLVFSDLSLAVSSGGGPFVPRTLAAAQSATDDGVSVVSGTTGSITITLASGAPAIAPTDIVRIIIGNNNFITSPASAISYRIRMATRNAATATIDSGTAMIALVTPIDVSMSIPIIMASLSNGLPSGLLPGGTTNVLLSFNTDIAATCRYATSASSTYMTMLSSTTFTDANNWLLHYQAVPTVDNTIYNFYIRCQTLSSMSMNDTDYPISFEIGVVPNASSTPTPPAPPPPPPGPSGPPGPGGGGGLFLKGGDVTLDGSTFPQGSIVITQDGAIVKEDSVSVVGKFNYLFTQLQRGTYTWGVYVKDPNGNKSSTYSSTIYLIGGTNNVISPIYVSPTIVAKSTTVDIGEDIEVSGFGIPLTPVLAVMNRQGNVQSQIITASTTANGNGSWKLKLSTKDLNKGTYQIKAQSLVTKKDQSNFSPVIYIGVGENANPDFKNRADLNRDGKVNLVDFSILLFNWKGTDEVSDINQDGNVNLTDFSIMLSNWTG